ncbi:hypothetical protein RUM43_004085 [Polyplax serrata]|uniref:E3 ubiquitin-protein ligase synoviolin-like TPR repeats domain-containing protein n=1 Tax=Polyplax serrata TaxID=468196 RepID=A0AAN8SAI7_POLSC
MNPLMGAERKVEKKKRQDKSLVNMAYCCLLLLGAFIQKIVFGELRVSEQQHMKDKFWNFIFYKFIFVFGIINVQYLHEVVFWCAWFSILGFLNLLTQLGKDRFEYPVQLNLGKIRNKNLFPFKLLSVDSEERLKRLMFAIISWQNTEKLLCPSLRSAQSTKMQKAPCLSNTAFFFLDSTLYTISRLPLAR